MRMYCINFYIKKTKIHLNLHQFHWFTRSSIFIVQKSHLAFPNLIFLPQLMLHKLDTPRTARARSGWDEKCEVSTFFKKVQKSGPKTGHNIFHFALIATLRPLFAKKFWNRDFKTSLLGGIWLPPIFFSIKNQKNPDGRTDERTDTRNTQFWLSHGRKERFAQ